jgi:hypothetical protein
VSGHLGDAVHEPLTTKEGWARFVAADPKPPPFDALPKVATARCSTAAEGT